MTRPRTRATCDGACDGPRYAALFRNVNLGRPGSPTRTQLEDAFADAGAAAVASFQAHGNVAFVAADDDTARAVTTAACARLRAVCGLREPAFLRRMAHLAVLVAADPFACAPRDAVHQQCVSLLPALPADGAGIPAVDHAWPPQLTLPIVTPRRDAEIFALAGGEAFSVTRRVGGHAGPVNAILERALGGPLTTRSWTTITRLVAAHTSS